MSSVLFSYLKQAFLSARRVKILSYLLLAQEHIELARASFPVVFKDILDKQHFESNMFFR